MVDQVGMSVSHSPRSLCCQCHWCGSELVRKRQSVEVRLHFCNNVCKAQHQRTSKPVTKDWLYGQYVTNGLNTTEIGRIVGRDPKSVWNWLKDFGIPSRPRGGHTMPHAFKRGERNLFEGMKHTPETRKKLSEIAKADGRVPYDRAVGPPMKGRKGSDHPAWKGGVTAERQAFYATEEWTSAARLVKKRDKNTCQRCGKVKVRGDGQPFDIHHIVSFVCVELRADIGNLVYLCEPCHYWVHGNRNTAKDFIKECP